MIEKPVLEQKYTQKYVGAWVCNPTMSIRTMKKPCWFKRKVVEFLFGWSWINE